MQTILYALPLVFVVMLACYWAHRAGRRETQAEDKKAEHENDMEARRIEDRLRRDADYARRVRERFTR